MLIAAAATAQSGSPSFAQFQRRFPDDAACLRALMIEKFGGTQIHCPGCRATSRFHAMAKRRAYACQKCGFHIYPCAGTILRRTRTPLSRLLFAMHLLASSGGTISAAELERQVGFSYKTARRITKAFQILSANSEQPERASC